MNPVKQIRERLGMSQESLAKSCGLTSSMIYQTEKGLMKNVSQKILNYFNLRGEEVDVLNVSYQNWIKEQRHSNSLPGISPSIDNRFNVHPLVGYIVDVVGWTSTEFIDRVLIPKAVFYNYSHARQRNMPELIRVALADSGLSKNDIDLLDSKGRTYYDLKQKSRRVHGTNSQPVGSSLLL